MRKYFKICILMFISIEVNANMSEFVYQGTMLGRPFVNQYVDIIREDLKITVDSLFSIAKFEITYHIKASKSGIKIPFLFYAYDLKNDFIIFIDNKQIKPSQIPDTYNLSDSSKFHDFSYFFSNEITNEGKVVLFEDSPNGGFYLSLDDFLYFETDISEGEHEITASYTADKWIEEQGWIKEYSFRYALSPAKYWKSFGSLTISLDASDCIYKLTTNIGLPTDVDINNIKTWQVDSLPTEILKIIYIPEISSTAATLIKISPERLACMVGIVLLIIHFILIYLYRKIKPLKRFSWIVIAGSIIFPLIFFISWVEFYTLIENMIGEHATRKHGYIELVFFLYPILMPIYWLIMWLVDKWIKKRQNKYALRL